MSNQYPSYIHSTAADSATGATYAANIHLASIAELNCSYAVAESSFILKICSYCGKENRGMVMLCAECGSTLNVTEEAQSDPRIGEKRVPLAKKSCKVLDAKLATILLLIYFGVQVSCGISFGVLTGIIANSQQNRSTEETFRILAVVTMLTAPILSGVATILMAFVSVPDQLRERSPNSAAWVAGNLGAIARSLIVGVVVAASSSFLARTIGYHFALHNLGPVEKMAFTPGITKVVWVIVGVLVAPFAEELLFRGVVYGGYRKSFGPLGAAAISTVVFLLSHFPQLIAFPPSVIGLTGLAVSALWGRLHSNAVGGAIAVHIGYNAWLSFSAVREMFFN